MAELADPFGLKRGRVVVRVLHALAPNNTRRFATRPTCTNGSAGRVIYERRVRLRQPQRQTAVIFSTTEIYAPVWPSCPERAPSAAQEKLF